MTIYTVTWVQKMRHGSMIEADSPEEALEIAKTGRYDDVDCEPFGREFDYKVEEGEHFQGRITRKTS